MKKSSTTKGSYLALHLLYGEIKNLKLLLKSKRVQRIRCKLDQIRALVQMPDLANMRVQVRKILATAGFVGAMLWAESLQAQQFQVVSTANGVYPEGQLADMDNDGDLDVVRFETTTTEGAYFNVYYDFYYKNGKWYEDYSYTLTPYSYLATAFYYHRNDGTPEVPVFTPVGINDNLSSWFTYVEGQSYSQVYLGVKATVLADIDNDGDEDLVFWDGVHAIDYNMTLRYIKNTGTPSSPYFSGWQNYVLKIVTSPVNYYPFNLFAADLDDDGNQDILVNDNSLDNFYYPNIGSATLPNLGEAVTLSDVLQDALVTDVADVDCDNDPDIIIGTTAYLNDGDAGFPNTLPFVMDGVSASQLMGGVKLIDFDNDQDLDFFNQTNWFKNQGFDWFVDADNDNFGTTFIGTACVLLQDNQANSCGDCNDTDASIHPSEPEILNNIDDDCDFVVDDVCSNVGLSGIKSTKYNANTQYLHWPKVPDATAHQVQYRVAGTTAWTVKGAYITSVQLANLTTNATYEYRIRTQCPTGWTSYSSVQTFITGTPANCNKITLLASRPFSAFSTRLYWNYKPSAIKYRVRYRLNVPGSTWHVKIATINPDKPEMTLSGLTPSASYVWQVQALCALGTAADWNIFSGLGTFTMSAETGCFVAAALPEPEGENIADVAEIQEIKVFPNPAENAVTIAFDEQNRLLAKQITLLDNLGRVVSEQQILAGEQTQYTFDISQLAAGIYVVSVRTTEGIQSKLLVVQR